MEDGRTRENNSKEEMTISSIFDEKGESFQEIMEKILMSKIMNNT